MKTIDKLKMLNICPSDLVQQLRKIMDLKRANEFITSALMTTIIKSDIDVFSFCDCMDQLVDSRDSKQFIATLREGKYYQCVKTLQFN